MASTYLRRRELLDRCFSENVKGGLKNGCAIKRAFIGNTHAMNEPEGQTNYNRLNFNDVMKGILSGGKDVSDLIVMKEYSEIY